MRIFKYFFYFVLFLILLISLAATALNTFIDPNDYKTQINEELSRETGRPVKINGSIAWSFWPGVGFNLQDINIGKPIIKIKEADIHVKLFPLLKKKIEINSFVLTGIDIQQANQKHILIDQLSLSGETFLPAEEKILSWEKARANAQLKINSLKVGQLRAQNIHVLITLKNSIMKLDPITAQVYEGKYTGNINLNFKTKQFSAKQSLQGIQIQPLLEDLKSITHLKIRGTANLTSQLQSTSDEPIKKLNGDLQFTVNKGVLSGINIEHLLTVLSALKEKQTPPPDMGPTETPFESLSGTFHITNGVARNEDLLLRASFMQAKGAGKIDLAQQQIDYRLDAVKINPENNQPRNDVLPIVITGTLEHPKVAVDFQSILKVVIQKELEKHSVQLQDKLKEKVGNALENLLAK